MEQETKDIRVTEVLSMLDKGMTRDEIRNHYGLSRSDLNRLFSHEKLKGRKTKKRPSFNLIDDTGAENNPFATNVGSVTYNQGEELFNDEQQNGN